jgi:hypothetical protein
MSILDEPGELSEVPLAAVLIDALNERATGVLSVEHGGGLSRAFVRAGVPVGAQSFTGFRPLGEILLAEGLIDAEVLGASLAETARSGRLNGEVLVEMGAVSREQVDLALSDQQAGYLAEVAALATGRFRFDRAEPIPAWTEGIRISPLKAIVQAMETPQAKPLVVSALQPAATGPIAIASGYGRLATAFGWNAAEAALVARLQSLTTLDAFFADPGVPPERARAILASLLLLGLASGRGRPGETLESVPGVVVDLADLAGVPIESDASEPERSSPNRTLVGVPAASPPAPAGPPRWLPWRPLGLRPRDRRTRPRRPGRAGTPRPAAATPRRRGGGASACCSVPCRTWGWARSRGSPPSPPRPARRGRPLRSQGRAPR